MYIRLYVPPFTILKLVYVNKSVCYYLQTSLLNSTKKTTTVKEMSDDR